MLLALHAGPAAGQSLVPVGPVYTSWGIGQGLSHGNVLALLQDSVGFLWIGTAGGLNRFDGTVFRTYIHQAGDSRSLSDDRISALMPADNGRLWVGTERGGLNLFDPADGTVERFELYDLGPWATDTMAEATETRQGRTITSIVPFADSTLLLLTDIGIIRFDYRTGQGSRLPDANYEVAATALCALLDRRVLAGFSDGRIAILSPPGESLANVAQIDTAVRTVRCPSQERGYAASASGAIYAIDPFNNTVQHIGRAVDQDGLPARVRDLASGPDGDLWIAAYQGLFILSREDTLARPVPDPERRMLPFSQMTALLTDASGALWFGTWNGIAVLHPLSLTITRIFNGSGTGSGILGRGVITLERVGNSRFLVGTLDGGVRLLDSTTAGWRVSRVSALDAWPEATIFDITRGRLGDVWIAALTDGIVHLDATGSLASTIAIRTRDGRTASPTVNSVFVDRTGVVWAGTQGLGLLRFDTRERVFVEYRGPDGSWDFGSRYVWPIAEDTRGNLWVGAYNGGLSVIGYDRRTHRRYAAGPDGLSDDRILTVFPDSRGLIWIGTEGGGLNRLDPATETFRRFNTRDGLPHDNVESITEDASRNIWISTHGGLARFDPRTEQFWVLREAAGLVGDRYFANSVLRDDRGRFLFGGSDGISIVDPSALRRDTIPLSIALTRFSIRGDEVPLTRVLREPTLDLEPHENFFTFEFAALDYRDPALTRYRYQLDDLDDDWIESGARGVANYTSVPPGRYTFRVAARTSEGVWHEGALSIAVRVQAPYHQTWWFRSAAIATVLLLITLLYSYRLREMRRRQDLRLGIAGRLHDDIGADLSAMAVKAEMVMGAAALDPDRRDQLADIGRLAREMALKVRETVWVVNTKYDTVAGLITKMRDTADTMLAGQVSYGFDVPENIPDRNIDMERRQAIYLVFKEALHNILRHADARSVHIRAEFDGSDFSLTIRDDGKGFDPAAAADGNGLGLMRTRPARYGGKLEIISALGTGTTISMRLRIR